MPRRRLRTFTLWTGALLSLLIAAAFVVSAWWEIALPGPTSRGPSLILMAGSAMIVHDDMAVTLVSADTHSFGLSRWNCWVPEVHRRLPRAIEALLQKGALAFPDR